MDEIIAFTDGSSSRKNQKIGSGFCTYNSNKELIESFSIGFEKCGRNGAAELVGMIFCLENLLPNKDKKITIYCDAQYVTKSITEWVYNWTLLDFFQIKNIELMLYMLWLNSQFSNLSIQWIKGHQEGDSFEINGNKMADKLAGKYKEKDFNNLHSFDEFIIDIECIIKENNIKNKVKTYYQYTRI